LGLSFAHGSMRCHISNTHVRAEFSYAIPELAKPFMSILMDSVDSLLHSNKNAFDSNTASVSSLVRNSIWK
jgi:hypothetical protein